MKTSLFLLASSLLLCCTACGSRASRVRLSGPTRTEAVAPRVPDRYTYTVLRSHAHSVESYTQGLQYADGALWESTGEYGLSVLQRLDLERGTTEVKVRLPRSEFGEGLALHGDSVYLLTWMNNTAHLYDRATFRPLGDFRYAGEGWGLATDGERLYMSDGTDRIRVLDPTTFRPLRDIPVTCEGEPVGLLNELEWIEGRIWANVYTTDLLCIIDPATGVVEGIVDLAGLLPDAERTPQTDVLNGIAYDAATGRLFVTGKRWPKIYEIELVKL